MGTSDRHSSSASGTAAGANNGSSRDASSRQRASRQPKLNKYTQQVVPAWRPVLSPRHVVSLFVLVGVIFVPLGAVILNAALSVVEYSVRYDEVCIEQNFGAKSNSQSDIIMSSCVESGEPTGNKRCGEGVECSVTIEVDEDMDSPVFVYYELDNFYQNHRRYVSNREDRQLSGEDLGESATSACEPQQQLPEDEFGDEPFSNRSINPCGLIAWSNFNDSYSIQLVSDNGTDIQQLSIQEDGIAWQSDIDNRFGDYEPTNYNEGEVPLKFLRGGNTIQPYYPKTADGQNDTSNPDWGRPLVRKDEHFIVWMRVAALPRFRKLWGKINQDIRKGDVLEVSISSKYNSYRYDGKKSIVLSTQSWVGGKNRFLGIAYLVVGGVCILLGFGFLLLLTLKPRELGNCNDLSWNKAVQRKSSGLPTDYHGEDLAGQEQ